jgi:hypothetical protein
MEEEWFSNLPAIKVLVVLHTNQANPNPNP